VLDRFPNATAVGLDISEPMMDVGRQRMAQYGNRFSYHVGDFAEGSLPADLPRTFDAAVASASIHHLPSEAKQALYREVFAHLNPGGCFFNVDQVVPVDESARLFYRSRREAERASRPAPPPTEPSAHTVLTHHHIETVPAQIGMLQAAGFEVVDCFYKRLQQTIIGGYKPRA
jgi:tRNA (cmo5U34)-methyltransferase